MSRGQTRLTGIFCPAGLPESFINEQTNVFSRCYYAGNSAIAAVILSSGLAPVVVNKHGPSHDAHVDAPNLLTFNFIYYDY